MTHENIPLDNPDHEVLPASPGRRRVKLLIATLFIIAILTFLLWFVFFYGERSEGSRGWLGMAAEGVALPVP